LYGYKHFKAARIVYFPLANPSGFEKEKRETYPGKLDPNRDYPIDKNQECYRTTATHILDHLFRIYSFDLTVILHNGDSQISFPWGTFAHIANSHTQDYSVMRAAAEMMQGEADPAKLQEFKVGTMSEVIYPASGTFDDWAYAASKKGMTNPCQGK
jgi:predicted deacylase